MSKYFYIELNKLKKDYPNIIKEIRGKGLLIGMQLHFDQSKFIKSLEKNYLLTIRASENVVRILPPLTVKKNEIIALRGPSGSGKTTLSKQILDIKQS